MESHDGRRERVTWSWDHALDPLANHVAAMALLLVQLATDAEERSGSGSIWDDPDRWHCGATDRGYVWVYMSQQKPL